MIEPLHDAMSVLLRELLDGAAHDAAWILNREDRGLLASLDALSADRRQRVDAATHKPVGFIPVLKAPARADGPSM